MLRRFMLPAAKGTRTVHNAYRASVTSSRHSLRQALPPGEIGRLPHHALNHNPPFPGQKVDDDLMPPDYELQSYWKQRFIDEKHFEWLGDGKDTVLPHVRAFLLESGSSDSQGSRPPVRLLHIGAGTSSLSERLRELYIGMYGDDVDERSIVNTDFAENLVARKQAGEETRRAVGGQRRGMRWKCVDAMRWDGLENLLEEEPAPFDLVVDKSTSDAISCGEDVSYGHADRGLHPAFDEYLKTHGNHGITFSPVEVLAIHLSSLVRPGGLWVALTFSSDRFAFLSTPGSMGAPTPRAANYWDLERVITVDAPTGAKGNVHAPLVQHYVCLIRRRERPR
ncbi:hypothetical protein BV20DRAFT_960217 [Pilatotrama ljubarskyi]|nr:hypothetical protein BV20DRAFT_960217 [Pilatotrama ljubarskyi]